MHRLFLVFSLIAFSSLVNSQCVLTNFNVQPTACLNETIPISNLSGSGSYLWDFCVGDFSNSPTAQSLYTLPQADGRPGMEFAKDGNLWYAFTTGTSSNVLFRLQFENGILLAPTSTENLGDLNGALKNPGQVRIVNEGNLWYGFLHNTSTGDLLKLSFGDKLSNPFTTQVLLTGIGYFNSGFALSKHPVDGWVCVMSTSANQFKIIRMGNSLSSPMPGDILTSATVPNPNALGDVDLVNVCGNWFGFASNLGDGGVYRLQFGSNLFGTPTIDQVASLPFSNLGRLRIVKDGENYVLLVVTLSGSLEKLYFGNDLTQSPTIIDEGNLGNSLPGNIYLLAVAKENSDWVVVTASQGTGKAFHIYYPNNCSTSPQTSTVASPQLKFSTSGNYKISLDFATPSGAGSKTKNVLVSSLTPPDIDFTSQNVCINNPVNFTSINSSGNINSYNWYFGNSNTSSAINPISIYASVGSYIVSLNVSAINGCSNFVQKNVQIFNQPTASFTLPSTSPICTNQNYTFTNSTTFDVGANPTWQWSVNDTAVAITQNLTQTFASATSKRIQLIASIPGCSSLATQTIGSLQPGPVVNFSAPSSGCQEVSIDFVSTTTGAVANYLWDFGDGNTTNLQNPTKTFSTSGSYSVSLLATNSVGCQNSKIKPIAIYSKPQPNFIIGLPPFSCSGSASQFNDLTPSLTDSNITSWRWGFGDSGNGLSALKNPTYTYSTAGSYTVSLQVGTNFGCANSIQKSVTIAQSPQASFSNLSACVNQGTKFTDTSTGGVKSRLWQMGFTTSTIANPTYTFTAAGSFPVILTITGNNNCVNQISKNINVPIVPELDFSVSKPCTNSTTIFTEVTNLTDPSTAQSWAFGSLANANGSPVQYSFSAAASYLVRLNSTRKSGCIYSLSKNVSIVDSPVASFIPSTEAGASPLGVSFTNNSVFSNSYLWNFGDSGSTTSTQTSPVFVFTELGDYKVELSALNNVGCSNKTSKVVSVVIPHVDAVMTDFYFVKDAATNALQPVVTLVNKSNVSITDPVILIDVMGGSGIKKKIISTLKPNQQITQSLDLQLVPTSGQYVCAEVQVVGDEDLFLNRRCLTLTGEEILFAPFPNPVKTELNLDWISTNASPVTFQIINSSGGITFQQTITAVVKGINRFVINTSELKQGIYYIRFSDNEVSKAFNFVVSGN